MKRKFLFILNPAAGRGKALKIREKLEEIIREDNLDAYIVESLALGHIEEVANYFSSQNLDTEIRIFACGGDGTLGETVNGVMANGGEALIGCIPFGTGNDFVRNWKKADFFDFRNQIYGEPVEVDVLKYIDHRIEKELYCMNMFNIGFDARVALSKDKISNYPLMAGSTSYTVSIFYNMISMPKEDITVKIEKLDGTLETIYDGEALLTTIGNGAYCGGGIKALPLAKIDDSLIDIQIIKNISRRELFKFLPSYIKGIHLEEKGIDKYLIYEKCKKIHITPKYQEFYLCVDGALRPVGDISIEILPKKIKFIVPKEKN